MSAGRCDVLAPVQCATEDRWPHTRAGGSRERPPVGLVTDSLALDADDRDDGESHAAWLARKTRRPLAAAEAGLRAFRAAQWRLQARPAPDVEVGIGFLPVDFGPRCPVCRIPHHAYDVEHAADRGQPCARCQGDEHDPQHGPACEPRAEVV